MFRYYMPCMGAFLVLDHRHSNQEACNAGLYQEQSYSTLYMMDDIHVSNNTNPAEWMSDQKLKLTTITMPD